MPILSLRSATVGTFRCSSSASGKRRSIAWIWNSFVGSYRRPVQSKSGSWNFVAGLMILMIASRLVCADRFVRHGALPALDAVVDAELADRSERFVVERWNA